MEYSRFKVADQDESGGLNVEELKTMLFPRHHDHMVDHTVQVSGAASCGKGSEN